MPTAIVAAAAWFTLAATSDGVLTLGVALIGAAASIATALISRGNRNELRKRRTIITRHENGVTITDEDLEELADGE